MFPLKLREGARPADLHFGELGYAREARASYLDFLDARRAGTLRDSVRFQVCLPTPYAVISLFCVPEDAQKILPAYERAMLREVERIAATIPHQDLALQWDVCVEMLQWDGRWPVTPPFPGMEEVYADMFRRLSAAVPADIELGFHLCYGDADAVHFVEPLDATKMVELANLIVDNAGRGVAFVHMPVPINRTDDAFYAPLSQLRLPAETELYLGLVHASDGVEGTRRRMAVASKYVPEFGIASECGISRGRHPDLATEFLRVYAAAAECGPAGARL
jgi:methionine synthase II (cobalamin-independent)